MSQDKPGAGPVRIRSRFPKAQPNIAISSGLARIRRLSGHYSSNEHETAQIQPTSNEPTTTIQQQPTNTASQKQLIESVLSPKITIIEPTVPESTASPRKPLETENSPLTFRQMINSFTTNSPALISQQPGTPLPQTPGGSLYHPKFSKEHIMNIIKYKALQKLKKIESETLKEKRKKYKKNSILYKLSQQINQTSSDTSNSNILDENSQSMGATAAAAASTSQLNLASIDRSKLRMRDFLYYNPKIVKKSNEPPEVVIDAVPSQEIIIEGLNRSASAISLALNSENETNDTNTESTRSSNSSSCKSIPPTKPVTAPTPKILAAPQLKISEDGTIVINEESLVIQREYQEPVYDSTIVESEQNNNLTYNSYRKFHHTKKWTEKETAKFYKALSMVGTDFTMIQKFFPHRTRDEIKRKFKREEKLNQALIDKILSKTAQIDLSVFVSSSSEDEQEKDESKNLKKSKKQTKKSTDQAESIEGQSSKKPKLKRVQKRAFIDSESDSNENSESKNKKGQVKKSKQFISDSEGSDGEPKEKVENASLDLAQPELVVQLEQLSSENKPEDLEKVDEEEIELVFDLDNNNLMEIKKEDKKETEVEEEEEEEDEENIILDLDNNTIIRTGPQENKTVSKSSITITKLNSTNNE